MNNNLFLYKIFPLIRIILFIMLLLTFIIIPVEVIEKRSLCSTYNHFNIICITCGVTRAFSNIMHLNFIRAFKYNDVFTLAIFPICMVIFINDLICYFYRIVKGKCKYSYIEFLMVNIYD